MISIVLVVICIYYSNKEKWLKKIRRGQALSSLQKHFIHALPALFLPFVILGGIYSGLMTPTESAAVAVIYSFYCKCFCLPGTASPGYLPYTSGLRKEQCHDFIHHCNLHSIFHGCLHSRGYQDSWWMQLWP